MDAALFDQVKASARRLQVSSLSVLMAAWAILLNRLSAQSQFTIGVPTAGHNEMGVGHFVGYASEVKGVTVAIDPEQTTDAFIHQITERIRLAQQDQPVANMPISSLFNVDRGVSLTLDNQPRWGWVPVSCVKQPLFLNILEFNGNCVSILM
ncbi:condensation domain-containing protein [Vibrio sp. PP-XX7]